jgi:hypothetical protein
MNQINNMNTMNRDKKIIIKLGLFIAICCIIFLYVTQEWQFNNNIWWLLFPIIIFILHRLYQLNTIKQLVSDMIDSNKFNIGKTLLPLIMLYNAHKKVFLISFVALYILLLFYSLIYKFVFLFIILLIGGLKLGFNLFKQNTANKEINKILNNMTWLSGEELFFSIIIFAISCIIISYNKYLEYEYFALYILLAFSVYMMFLYKERYFYMFALFAIFAVLLTRIYTYNFNNIFYDFFYIILLLLIIFYGNKISTLIFMLNKNYEDSRIFRTQIKNFKFFIWILSTILILTTLESLYDAFSLDASAKKLQDSAQTK